MDAIFPKDGLDFFRLKAANSLTQTRIQVRIPKTRYQDPIISNLINRYSLQVNILSALLDEGGQGDGWFELEVSGQAAIIHTALLDLIELEADIWIDTESQDGR